MSASKSALSALPTMMTIPSSGDFGAGNIRMVCSCALSVAGMSPLESTTLLGKEHGELSIKHMV